MRQRIGGAGHRQPGSRVRPGEAPVQGERARGCGVSPEVLEQMVKGSFFSEVGYK